MFICNCWKSLCFCYSHLSLSACCFRISLIVPSISFSLSVRVSLSAWAVSSSSATLNCSVILDLLGRRDEVGQVGHNGFTKGVRIKTGIKEKEGS